MKLNVLDLSDSITSGKGIKNLKMERLGSVVALVGKNGSGKTRILDLIEENISEIITVVNFLDNTISSPPNILAPILKNLNPYKEYLGLQKLHKALTTAQQYRPTPNIAEKIDSLSKKFSAVEAQLGQTLNPPVKIIAQNIINQQLKKPLAQGKTVKVQDKVDSILEKAKPIIEQIKQNYFRRIRYEDIAELQTAIDKTKDASSFENLLGGIADNVQYNEISSIKKTSFKYLSKLLKQLSIDRVNNWHNEDEFKKQDSYKRFLILEKYIATFLKKELKWTSNASVSNENEESDETDLKLKGTWKLEGKNFEYKKLSPGEKILFSYALMFFLLELSPHLRIKESIIIIDEPELHLHPDMEIELINSLREAVGEAGQLWIATHSINILSDLNYEEVFMVKDGIVKHPTHTTQKESLNELMHVEERIIKLSNFLTSGSEWSFVKYMSQCFTDPNVFENARVNDTQVTLFKKVLNDLSSNNNNMLLDFGAGKGRLYEQLKRNKNFSSKFSYCALEPEKTHHDKLKQLGIKNLFLSHQEVPENSFNFIVLCNVLHEIKLQDDWAKAINKIISSLKDGGYLVIIEPKILTTGEKIGNIGYLLLGFEELKKLFGLSEIPIKHTEKSFSNEINCAVFPKQELKPISIENIYAAMEELEKNTFIEIEKLREETDNTISIKKGRISAFYSQLHINARMAIKYLNSQIKTNGNANPSIENGIINNYSIYPEAIK